MRARALQTDDVAAHFVKDVAHHVMTVELDHGLYRHVRCAQPGTYNHAFTVTTWPGELCISGDMGTFVFSRLTDMFEFFRTDRGRINPSYWAEKLLGIDRHGVTTWSPELFREALESQLDQVEAAPALRAAVQDEVASCADDGPERAFDAAREFCWEDSYPLEGVWEHTCDDYTYHFLWCCQAIVWTIAQWDAAHG
jgi:hypothetical protein